MLHEVYAVYNSKAKFFNQPFTSKTDGEAERSFEQAVNDPQTFINRYPEDYDLYYLGQFDDNTGKYQTLKTPEHKFKAVQLLKAKDQILKDLRKSFDILKQLEKDQII